MSNKYKIVTELVGDEPKIYIGVPAMETIKLDGKLVYILEKSPVVGSEDGHQIVLCACKKAGRIEFIRWFYNEKRQDFYWGHYFNDYESALADYKETVAKDGTSLADLLERS